MQANCTHLNEIVCFSSQNETRLRYRDNVAESH